MRRYDDQVEVRRGLVDGSEGPAQFLWRSRLWVVCEVLAHWVETGTWWEEAPVRRVLGTEAVDSTGERPDAAGAGLVVDLLGEREVWRVEAACGRSGYQAGAGSGQRGVFDLSFDWAGGQWRLVRAVD